jgi:SH3 domain protein
MIKRPVLHIVCILGCGLLAVVKTLAAPAWVSDNFEIMLRSGPSSSNAIQLMITSGTQLDVLERDEEAGYSRVRTGGGTEGWVLSRYLMSEPPAREQLATLTSQLTSANAQGTSMSSQLEAVKGQYESAGRQIRTLESERDRLESELAEIRRTAANVLSIDSQNKELQQQLTDAEIKASILEQENQELSSQQTRYWFLSGALVLLVGIISGLWLPRVRWQRQSRYDSF